MKIKFTKTVECELSLEDLANAFCQLDDDEQAKFFVLCAQIAKDTFNCTIDQWWEIGRHLRTCTCATEDARDMVKRICEGME